MTNPQFERPDGPDGTEGASGDAARSPVGRGADVLRRAGALAVTGLGAALWGAAGVVAAAAQVPVSDGCFQQCLPERLTGRTLDDFTVRDGVRACRDLCEGRSRERLAAEGRLGRFEGCAEKEMTPDDILRMRQASGPYFIMLTNFVWEITNPFPDRVLKGMEIRHFTPTMNEVGHSARTIVPPGEKGTFVMVDLGELLPQLKHTLKVTRVTYCDAP